MNRMVTVFKDSRTDVNFRILSFNGTCFCSLGGACPRLRLAWLCDAAARLPPLFRERTIIFPSLTGRGVMEVFAVDVSSLFESSSGHCSFLLLGETNRRGGGASRATSVGGRSPKLGGNQAERQMRSHAHSLLFVSMSSREVEGRIFQATPNKMSSAASRMYPRSGTAMAPHGLSGAEAFFDYMMFI